MYAYINEALDAHDAFEDALILINKVNKCRNTHLWILPKRLKIWKP